VGLFLPFIFKFQKELKNKFKKISDLISMREQAGYYALTPSPFMYLAVAQTMMSEIYTLPFRYSYVS